MSGGQWGGSREGAGRKPDDYEPTEEKIELEAQRARHEKIKADQREFKLAQERGEYVSREAVKQAVATALSILTQSLRSIPDNCERTLALQPAVVAAIEEQIDAGLNEVAKSFRSIAGE